MRFKGGGIACEQFRTQTPIKPLIIYGIETESDRLACPSMWPYCATVGVQKIGSLLLSGSKRREGSFSLQV